MTFDMVVHLSVDESATLDGVRFSVGLRGGTASVALSTLAGESLLAGELTADPDGGEFEAEALLPLEEHRIAPSRYEVPLVLKVSGDSPAIAYVHAIAEVYGSGCQDGELTLEISAPGDTGDSAGPIDTAETGDP